MRRIETFDWWDDLVNDKDRLSLRELAEKYSVTPGAISAAMRRTNLSRQPAPPGPRARRKHAEHGSHEPTPPVHHAAPKAASPRAAAPLGAWRVVLRSAAAPRVKVVVAATLSEAVRRVEDAKLGPVVSIEWVGETL